MNAGVSTSEMAVRVNGEGITLWPACEADNRPTNSNTAIRQGNISRGRASRRKCPFRTFGSSRLLIILAWTFIIKSSVASHELSATYSNKGLISPSVGQFNDVIYFATYAISCPIASLLAEVFIGRYKLVSYTLRVLWLLFIAGSMISVCEYCLLIPSSASNMIIHYLVSIPVSALNGAFTAVVISLAIDQISDGSSANISALVVWFIWALFSGFGCSYIIVPVFYKCTHFHEGKLISSLLPVVLLSVGLVLDFNFHHILIKEPVSANPVKLIFKVLKYAAKHKYPVQRSAFTYCENKQPTRLDYGKSKYGGPFTTEQVEDVKTFWRILLVVLVISMLYIPLLAVSTQSLKQQFHPNSHSQCIQHVSNGAYTPYSFIAYTIPLYELLVYPCLRNRGPTILQSAGVGAGAMVLTSFYGMMVETFQEMTNSSTECMFAQNKPSTTTAVRGLYISAPFNLILGLTIALLYKSSIEFVCAQAPYNMNGLLIGLSVMLRMLSNAIGGIFRIVWKQGWFEAIQTSKCGIWFYLTMLLTSLAISVLLLLVVRWYKARERDEMQVSQAMVEDVYFKYSEKHRTSAQYKI